jgi:formate dehydrogenase subunit gamma
MGGHSTNVGRWIERFTPYERTIHWTVAITFVILEVSGLIIAFGKFFLLPIIGGQLFGWLTYALKTLHNFVGPVFAVALVLFMVAYVRDNWWRLYDLKWLLYGIKGMVTGHEYPSHKFNAGEKSVFWLGVVFLGLLVVASGFVLDKLIPGMNYLRIDMQVAHLVHLIASLLMMTLFLVHMYLGTIGLDGAYQAMRTGWVDEAWAKEHHEYWYDDIKAGRIPAIRSGAPVPTSEAAVAQARAQ